MKKLASFIALFIIFAIPIAVVAQGHSLFLNESYHVAEPIDRTVNGLSLRASGPGCVLLAYTSSVARESAHEYWQVPYSGDFFIPLKANADLVLATFTNIGKLEITHLTPASVAAESKKFPLEASGNCDEIRKILPAYL